MDEELVNFLEKHKIRHEQIETWIIHKGDIVINQSEWRRYKRTHK